MTIRIVEAVRRLQQQIVEIGLGRNVLALPAPKTLAIAYAPKEEAEAANVFTFTITEPEIENVSRDLFASGHYSLAVQEAYKALDKAVSSLSAKNGSGTSLMDLVFSPNSPILCWSNRETTSQKDEQAGYHRLFSGAMMGIRNPVTHEFSWIDEAEVALELLVFAQHLLRKAKAAQKVK